MSDDTTLHFPHAATHPAVMYVPRHLVDHSSPRWGALCICVGLVLLTAAGVLLFRRSRPGVVKALGVVFALAAVPALYAAWSAFTAGTYVDVLPAQNHSLATSDPGDNPHQYFFSRQDALAQAKYVGSPRVSDASARAVAIRWADIPAADRAMLISPNADLNDVLPPDTSWSAQDSSIVDDYLNSTYGVVPMTDPDSRDNLHEMVVPPGTANDPLHTNLTSAPVLDLPDDPMHLEETGQQYRCRLLLKSYQVNELHQPVSATPEKLECFSEKDTSDSSKPLTKNTPRIYPKKVS